MSPLIQARDLTVQYISKSGFWGQIQKKHTAVSGANLSIQRGSCAALVGESGSGKSTLGQAMLGLLPIAQGEVLWQGQVLQPQDWQGEIRRRAQVIFQDTHAALNPRRTIGQALMDPLLRWGFAQNPSQAREQAAELLKDVHLSPDMLNRPPHAFSGGQRQRIGIARALACQPEFLLCDEITSALDVRVQAQVLELLAETRAKRNLTLLVITHDLAVAAQIADTVTVLKAGQIVESGPTQQVLYSPEQAYTRELLAAVPEFTINNLY